MVGYLPKHGNLPSGYTTYGNDSLSPSVAQSPRAHSEPCDICDNIRLCKQFESHETFTSGLALWFPDFTQLCQGSCFEPAA